MPNGTNDRGGAGAKSPIVGKVLIGYFGGEMVSHPVNYRRGAGAKSPTVGTVLMG